MQSFIDKNQLKNVVFYWTIIIYEIEKYECNKNLINFISYTLFFKVIFFYFYKTHFKILDLFDKHLVFFSLIYIILIIDKIFKYNFLKGIYNL